jgi:hypothetical protein
MAGQRASMEHRPGGCVQEKANSSAVRSAIVKSEIYDGHCFFSRKTQEQQWGPAAGDNRIGKNLRNHKLNLVKFRVRSLFHFGI